MAFLLTGYTNSPHLKTEIVKMQKDIKTKVIQLLLAFVFAYLIVFLGTVFTIYFWTSVRPTTEQLKDLAVRSLIFAPGVGFIFFISLGKKTRRFSRLFKWRK